MDLFNTEYVILAIGSRTVYNQGLVSSCLDREPRPILLLSGGARGGDTCCARWAINAGVKREIYHADWENLGRSAGYRRNELLVDRLLDFPNGYLVAFWDGQSKGCAHTINLCEREGIPTRIYKLKDHELNESGWVPKRTYPAK